MLKLLVPLDGSSLALQAVAHAVVFTSSFESELHLLQVLEKKTFDQEPSIDDFDWELRRTECQCYLEDLKETLTDERTRIHLHVREGDPATEISEFCRREAIDLMVLASHGIGGITRFPKGGTVQKIISRAEQSILIVPPQDLASDHTVSYDHILVAIDGSKRADWALFLASAIARSCNATLYLMQVVQEPKVSPGVLASGEGRELIERLLELSRRDSLDHLRVVKAQLPPELEVETRVLVAPEVAPAVDAVVREAGVDLLVLSAHGVTDGNRTFTAIAESIISEPPCPVLVFQDARKESLTLTPLSGQPLRSRKVITQADRAEAS